MKISSSIFVALCFFTALVSAAPQFGFRPVIPAFCFHIPVSNIGISCTRNVRPSIRYYYDVRTRDCERILYSGCGGTQNLFRSERECEARCDDFDNDDSIEFEDFFDFFGK